MIELQSVSKTFRDGTTQQPTEVFRSLDLCVRPNEFLVVLGPSGCGKSTLLNLVAGFLGPDTGRVLFDGQPVTEPGPDRGVVFQEAALFPWLTAEANVAFGLREMGLPREECRRRAQAALHQVGLNGFGGVRPHALSGGMKQRVALARVLVLEPRALLMDEPFGALDAASREGLQDELLRIWERERKTVLFVTHSVEEAACLADRVVVFGEPPRGVCTEIGIDVPRPRVRNAPPFLRSAARLREEFGRLSSRHIHRLH